MSCIINSIDIKNVDQKNILLTYDFSQQPSGISEFFIPLVIESHDYWAIEFILNTVNGINGSIDLSTSFISITSLGLNNSSPSGSFILPDNGLLFQPSNVVTEPLKFSSNFIKHGVENMIAVVSNTITFNNVGTYMMTTYLPIAGSVSMAWDPVLAIPPLTPYGSLSDIEMVLSNGDLTVTSVRNSPTMLLANTFQTGTKLMFSVTIDKVASFGVTSIGIGNLSMDTNSFLGIDSNSFGYHDDGTVRANGKVQCPPIYSSNVVDIAVDTYDMLAWVRVDGGSWSSNLGGTGGEPSSGAKGFDISYIDMTGGYKFGVNVFNDGMSNVGQTTYNTAPLFPVPDENWTFVPGVANVAVSVSNFNSYTNVNSQDTYFEILGDYITADSDGNLYFSDSRIFILKNTSIYA
jgi:hypothetical protein